MNADGQRAPAIGAGGRDSLARKTDCVAGRNAVKSAQSYRIPDHYMSNPSHHAEPRFGGDSVDGVVGIPNQEKQ
jgi:hypothetical protein